MILYTSPWGRQCVLKKGFVVYQQIPFFMPGRERLAFLVPINDRGELALSSTLSSDRREPAEGKTVEDPAMRDWGHPNSQ